MSVRTLNWYSPRSDLNNIWKNRWRLQVAQAVVSGSGTSTSSVVWKSVDVAPLHSISWKAEYALNWTSDVPTEGDMVRISSVWQPCKKGESFDIDWDGLWQPSAKPVEASNAGWLNVGDIKYSFARDLGIHIVVGVRDARTNLFEPIFVDHAALSPGSSARYQPKETVTWWLEGSNRSGQVFSVPKGQSATQDFTNPSDPPTGAFEWSTSFKTDSGQWVTTPGAAPQSFNAPPASAQLAAVSIGGDAPQVEQVVGTSWMVNFAVPLVPAALNRAAAGLYNILKGKFPLQEVQVERSGGSMLRVTLDAASGAVIAIGEALGQMQSRGDLPMNETWQIFPLDQPGQLQDCDIDEQFVQPPTMPNYPPHSAEPSFSGSNNHFHQS